VNPDPQAPAVRRRRIWPWVLGICLIPFVLLAIAAASFFTLERDAAALRTHVMAATDAGWGTKVQMSAGRLALGAVRMGLGFVHNQDVADARLALAAVRHASVGVYERTSSTAQWSREQLFADTDKAMQKRGWTRIVGVADKKETVLIYVPQDIDPDKPVEICLAVVSGKKLVVVSTSVDASILAELVARHSTDDVKHHFRFARF
jgi:hypothetical protein